MDKKLVTLMLTLCCMTCLPVYGNAPVNAEDFKEGCFPMQELVLNSAPTKNEIRALHQEEKKLIRLENRLERFQKHIQKQQHKNALGGISDPVDRWFWFWIFGWGLGLILTVLSGGLLTSGLLGALWFLAFIGGSVSLVMWLVKKFG